MSRHKYNVVGDAANRTFNDIVFDSRLEMRYYTEVILPLIESDFWDSVERQKKFVLQEAFEHNGVTVKEIDYVADFVLTDKDGCVHVVDVKGFADSTALLKRKLFWFRYPDIDYRWITYSAIDGGWVDYEIVKKNRARRKKEKRKHEEK